MSYTDRGTAVTQQSSNLTEAFMRKKALKDAKVIAQMQAARAIRPTVSRVCIYSQRHPVTNGFPSAHNVEAWLVMIRALRCPAEIPALTSRVM